MTSEPAEGSQDLRAWEKAYSDRIVASVNAVREWRGLTIRELAEKLSAAGWAVSLDTLNGILSSKKRSSFSVGEIFVFARALEVPPAFLLLGLPSAHNLPAGPMLPGFDATNVGGYLWIADAGFHPSRGGYMGLLPRYAERLDFAMWQNALWLTAGGEHDQIRDTLQEALGELLHTRNRWGEAAASGYATPELPPLPEAISHLEGHDPWSGRPQISQPLQGFSTPAHVEEAAQYWKNAAIAREEIDRLAQARQLPRWRSDD